MIIGVCEPDSGVYSETFIRAHVERLSGTVVHVQGGWPLWSADDRCIIPTVYRAAWPLARKLPSGWINWAKRQAEHALARFFLTRRVEVVMAEYGTTAASLLSTCRRARIPLVAHFHGVDAYHREELAAQREPYRRLFLEAAALVAVSRDMVEQLVGLGAPRDKVFCNSCGVDLAAFPPTNPAANPPLLVAVGRFVDKKAPYCTLLAFDRVRRACPDARLAMIGDGPLWNSTRQLAAALGLDAAVDFPGRQTHPQVREWLGRARAFVQHSVTTPSGDSEGTPVGILEASATALPVVGTRHGGIKEAVRSGETGFLVDELDIAAMAEAMISLVREPALAAQLGEQGRRHMAANYAMEISIGRLDEILCRAAKPRVHS